MAAQILDDAGVDRLSDLLDQRAVPHKGLNLEALDGFLSALAVSPEEIPEDEWQPLVWGGRLPQWRDAEDEAEVRALLAAHRELVSQRARHDGDPLPDRLSPLLWLPEDPDAEDDDALDIGHDWAHGFLRAVSLREAAWDAWLDAEEWIDDVFGLLDQLATGEVLDAEDPTAAPTPLTYIERLEIISGLPGMLSDLQHHRIEALTPREPLRRAEVPERNAPCPCGSGKKYKKCCGAAA